MKNVKNTVSLVLAGLVLASAMPNLRAMETAAPQGEEPNFDTTGLPLSNPKDLC